MVKIKEPKMSGSKPFFVQLIFKLKLFNKIFIRAVISSFQFCQLECLTQMIKGSGKKIHCTKQGLKTLRIFIVSISP